MMLFIDVDRDKDTGWEGYDYVVNRQKPAANKATLERNLRGWAWENVGQVTFHVAGNQMELCIPRALVGLSANAMVGVEFKWADNVPPSGDIMDFYSHGDVAPGGRFNYHYHAPQ